MAWTGPQPASSSPLHSLSPSLPIGLHTHARVCQPLQGIPSLPDPLSPGVPRRPSASRPCVSSSGQQAGSPHHGLHAVPLAPPSLSQLSSMFPPPGSPLTVWAALGVLSPALLLPRLPQHNDPTLSCLSPCPRALEERDQLFPRQVPGARQGSSTQQMPISSWVCEFALGCWAARPGHHRLGGTEMRLLQVWRLEVQGQVGGRAVPPETSPWHVDGYLLPVSSQGHPSVSVSSSLLRTPVILD